MTVREEGAGVGMEREKGERRREEEEEEERGKERRWEKIDTSTYNKLTVETNKLR